MSQLSQLKPKDGSTHYRKIVGRGRGSGMGQTSTKGHKGQKARSGGKIRWGFEGGQMPLSRRVPKFGFNNVDYANRYEILNLRDLGSFSGEVTIEDLVKAGKVTKNAKVKLLGSGTVDKPLSLKLHKVSAAAKTAIEKAGGKVEVLVE
jgi:large subunit ribosomal protein L15